MPVTAPLKQKSFSLFDADLPLLAADAAAEIDLLIPETNRASSASDLRYTNELLDRLKRITSSEEKFNVDRLLYEKSFLPSFPEDEQTLFVQPSELLRRLNELMNEHELFAKDGSNGFLLHLRNFFLEVSAFASASRSMLRLGSTNTPYATL